MTTPNEPRPNEAAERLTEAELVDIIEQAIFETDTGLEASILAAERIATALAAERAAGIDAELLAEWLHAAGVGCSPEVCEVRTATYEGIRRTMHETDARDILAARLAAQSEEPTP